MRTTIDINDRLLRDAKRRGSVIALDTNILLYARREELPHHDAHIAALVVEHGVSELWTVDRDFARFPGVRIRDPFTNPPGGSAPTED